MNFYNIDSSKINLPRKNDSYIPAGIHSNVTILGARHSKSETSEFLAIDLIDSRGRKLSHTEWPISTKIPFEKMEPKKQENTIKVLEGQIKRLTQIVEAILGLKRDEFILKGSSFSEIAESICNAINGKTEGKLFRVKVVYDKKGYTSLANRPDYTFIESMTVSEENSDIKVLDKDAMTRPPMKDTEQQVEQVLETTVASPATVKDEIPF